MGIGINCISIAHGKCPQMHSAFWRGLELLNSQETDAAQNQVQGIESLSKSNVGMGVVPKDVTLLEPVIDKLMSKVIAISI